MITVPILSCRIQRIPRLLTRRSPPSPDYMPGPEHPPSPIYVPYVPGPIYLEFMPPEEDVLPTEEQPLPAAVSPTTDSLDYPTNRDGGEEEEESFGDDTDDEEENKDEDKEEEEYLASTDSVPPQDARLLATPTPPPSPLFPLSLPLPQILSPLPQILLPPLPVSPPPLPASPTYPLGYKVAMIRLRAEVGVSEVTLPPQKRLCITLGPIFEVVRVHPLPLLELLKVLEQTMDLLALWMMRLGETLRERQDTYEIYGRLDDAQDDRSLMSGQLNMLRRDRCAHARTARLMKTEARLSPYRDRGVASSRPQETDTAHKGIDIDEDTANTCDSTLESAGAR
ncbi:hypothetical protein Tco_0924403 [Tanacetum coccineum]|uniref:Uncharacterized protein n=1 Tax=Tanacetum coccineum TaxID=301880 RepID=A0ABQ5DAS9_9ASTR